MPILEPTILDGTTVSLPATALSLTVHAPTIVSGDVVQVPATALSMAVQAGEIVDIVSPTMPGAEWTLAASHAHWTLGTNRAHWTLDEDD